MAQKPINERELRVRYRLVKLIQTRENDTFTITIADLDYDGMSRDEYEFDTHEEALEHAKNSEKWHGTVFAVLPTYYISNY